MTENKPKSKYKDLKEHHIRKGRYPIRLKLTIWDDGVSKPFIDIYTGVPLKKGYRHSHIHIHEPRIWNKIKKIIDTEYIAQMSDKHQYSEKVIQEEVNRDIEFIINDNVRLNQTVKYMSKLFKQNRENRLPEFENDLKEFEKLVSLAKLEGQLQKFLTKHTWLLGLEYENSIPQKIAPKNRYDFYVEKYDGFADIIEIKKSNDELFDKNGKITAKFGKAIQQLIDYIDKALHYGDSKTLSKEMDFNFEKPKGILIIGRQGKDPAKLKNLNFYFHNIEILTYDDVLSRANNIIKQLQNLKKKRNRKLTNPTSKN